MQAFLSYISKIKLFIILLLIALIIFVYLIQQGFWANINSRGMIRLAEEHWNKGEYSDSVYWYRSAYSSALMGGLRWKLYKIYSYRTGKLLEQRKLSEALEVCKQATKIWDQEGAASYECLSIEQELIKQK